MWNTTRSNQSTKQHIYSIVKVNYKYRMYIEIAKILNQKKLLTYIENIILNDWKT